MELRAIIALALGYGAFEAEVFRAGIQSIGRGQMEAARSLGMSYVLAMRLIILPQAIRRILPPLGNDFIALLKDSSLATVLAVISSSVPSLSGLRSPDVGHSWGRARLPSGSLDNQAGGSFQRGL